MRIAWTTDIHLNHVQMPAWDQWVKQLEQSGCDAIVITGDISEADDVGFQLRRIEETFDVPIYFVLGNHDFYGSSIGATRQATQAIARESDSLGYLTDCGPVELVNGVYLLGEDGWGDATEGDYESSFVRLNDFVAIKDFTRADRIDWPRLLNQLGAESAERLLEKLIALPAATREVLVATHVPPFRDACWYEGKTTDDNWAPFFVCGQVGHVLRRYAIEHPEIKITVLCGHTHNGGGATIEPNLIVHTAGADYGQPRVERIWEW